MQKGRDTDCEGLAGARVFLQRGARESVMDGREACVAKILKRLFSATVQTKHAWILLKFTPVEL